MRIVPVLLALTAVLALTSLSRAAPRVPGKTLVLLENYSLRQTHSTFFRQLQEQDFTLSFALADEKKLSLSSYGDRIYDNLIIFAPSAEEFGGSLTVRSILDFVDHGGNVIVAGSSSIGEPIREFGSECGFEFDEESAAVIDHINFDSKLDNGEHTTIVTDQIIDNKLIAGTNKGRVLFRGVGLVQDLSNPLTIRVLSAESTAYTYFTDEKISVAPHVVGSKTVLVGALQARNNARVLFSGSLDLFSDEFFNAQVNVAGATASPSANRDFAISAALWTFKRSGILRVSGEPKHHLAGQTTVPELYTVFDQIEYSLRVEELVDRNWVGYQGNDMQLEFVMLNPYLRLTLNNTGDGVQHASFQAPDVYGVFQFRVDYKRTGYTYVQVHNQIPVRPLQNTQYERFIFSAFPYYASAFSMMGGLFVFSLVFLYHREAPATKKN
ncbi:dolichyl-diphosphooligosaccharide-protein glycotransferase [Capsaspora owczarzaki ATCC 30864]|uniref:Dolichyl-diphosphooligosaccharide--protein glycosyltransferase 48 kDa subunit n=1 Tax=Capsaspora owczarzaki (strain ATCC 30864) TaxID=595528 RepID=A0A0D2WI49_CAPO3|nr:dolichyl-diphosphooligosaccharide-protein glycotransferase [Capsaspora owczarzaki ATCC 30864]KJE89475.1 dolichyl-diphosphooligosaccharide-protein glycotransferase [Capsaspora owczarzaki ATCC 30864]|eukprot:XP_004365807.1 dolichyl-diphosphooligosaccharide-protein glycotransferase [Capsaspora owczarzaki ATCC 30864]